jgi:hypothetical protein
MTALEKQLLDAIKCAVHANGHAISCDWWVPKNGKCNCWMGKCYDAIRAATSSSPQPSSPS